MKIRTLVLLYIFNVFVLACTHSESFKQDGELYAEYKNYTALLKVNDNYDIAQSEYILAAYTPRKQQTLVNAQIKSAEFLNELISGYLTFPRWIEKEFNHYETVSGEYGCLLLNGYNENQEPIAITVSYRYTNQWQIDDIQMEQLAPFNRFLSMAICDRQKLDAIRFREMM